MKTGNLSGDDFTKLSEAMGVLAEAPLYIDDTPGQTILEMRTKARRLHAQVGLKLLVVDYLQLVVGGGRFDSRVQEVAIISQGLKNLARELKIPVLALSQLNRSVETRGEKIPQLADLRESGCLLGNTLITRLDTGERVKIESLVGSKNVPILAMDGKMKLVPGIFSKVFLSGKKMVYKMRLRSGKMIEASGNHPFFTVGGWKRLDKLKIGDRVATPRKLKVVIKKKKIGDNRLVVLAHLIGDGCYLKNQPLHYTNSDIKLIKLVKKAAEKKVIPELIFQQKDEKIALFLSHLWATDGCVFVNNKTKGPRVRLYYASGNRGLVEQVSHLLLRLGILSTISSTRKKGYEDMWLVNIQGKVDQMNFLEMVGVVGSKAGMVKKAITSLKKIETNPNLDVIPKEVWVYIEEARKEAGLTAREFHRRVGWAYSGTQRQKNGLSRQRLAKVVRVLDDERLDNFLNSDLYWDEVIGIKKTGIQEVFDATVPKYASFVANDIVVHNSIEQDSDVVMFLYKLDDENMESFKLSISKHRNGPMRTGEMALNLRFEGNRIRFHSMSKRKE